MIEPGGKIACRKIGIADVDGLLRKRGIGLNSTVKHLLIWVLTVGVLLMGWKFVTMNMNKGQDQSRTVSEAQNDVDSNIVESVTINGAKMSGTYKGGKGSFHTTIPPTDPALYKELRDHGVNVTVEDHAGSQWVSFLVQLAPIAVLLA